MPGKANGNINCVISKMIGKVVNMFSDLIYLQSILWFPDCFGVFLFTRHESQVKWENISQLLLRHVRQEKENRPDSPSFLPQSAITTWLQGEKHIKYNSKEGCKSVMMLFLTSSRFFQAEKLNCMCAAKGTGHPIITHVVFSTVTNQLNTV